MDEQITIEEARDALFKSLEQGESLRCPVCTQRAALDQRRIHSTVAKALLSLYKAGSTDTFVHGPSLPGDTHEISQLVYWGLAEDEGSLRDDGGRAGFYRCSPKGEQWIHGKITVPKFALVFDKVMVGLEGPPWSIEDALGTPFNYSKFVLGKE